MKRLALICVIMLGTIALMWRFLYANEPDKQFILIDMTESDNKVLLVSFNDVNIEQKVILNEIEFFQGSPQGYYIAKNTTGVWIKGNYLRQDAFSKVDEKLIPPHCSYATISHDGKGIIWLATDGVRCSIILTDLMLNKNYRIRTKTGNLAYPAWAPENRRIAYYSSQLNSTDGYSLCVIDIPELGKKELDAVEWIEREIAPPSMPTRMSPMRSMPPRWSPDGMKVIFEARYDTAWKYTSYLVNVDGTNLKPAKGTWAYDSKHLYTMLMAGDTMRGYTYTPARLDLETEKIETDGYAATPKDAPNFHWSPDGQYYVAYTINNVILVNARTGTTREIVAKAIYCPVLWAASPKVVIAP